MALGFVQEHYGISGGAYMPNHKLYYSIPDEESIERCSGLIKRMINGEIISVK